MEQASQIESACRTPQGIMSLSPQSHQHLQQQVPVFAEQLAQLLKQLPEAGAETTSPAPAVPASSLAEVDVIIEELRQLITDGNYAAVEGLSACSTSWITVGMARAVTENSQKYRRSGG